MRVEFFSVKKEFQGIGKFTGFDPASGDPGRLKFILKTFFIRTKVQYLSYLHCEFRDLI